MKSTVKQLLSKIRREGVRRRRLVETRAMGRVRRFNAYDWGEDTFVFEKGVWEKLDAHASVLLIEKEELRHGAHGHVMTVSTGNHSVAALPLLQGLFWDLCKLPAAKRGDVMTHGVLCANMVAGKLEISQRDVPCARLVALDSWLVETLKFPLGDVVMLDRADATLQHYRGRGQEWRVKPLAWTACEMSAALAASRKRISTDVRYYHSSRGVHFLSYADFHAFAGWAASDFAKFRAALREMTSVFEGHRQSFLRQPKCFGHHEIELFGLKRGVAQERLVPALDRLMEGIVLGRISQAEAAVRIAELDVLYKSLLTHAELADDTSKIFTEMLYMHLTGEIYAVNSEGATPAFDDRRTALPGASFVDGRPVYHPGADARSEVLLSNLRALMSKDEHVEFANVYEIRTDDGGDAAPVIGQGKTREVVYKTNRRPLTSSLVEKRLARPGQGYGSYVIARVHAFKALGVHLPEFRLLRRRPLEKKRSFDYFIRERCEGEPIADLSADYFQVAGEFGGADAGEDPQVVLALAFLMGDAAAQNMAMKKYDPVRKTPVYGEGKEIYRFAYDMKTGRPMPHAVDCCSARGILGWPDTSLSDRNLEKVGNFYLSAYARHLRAFAASHPVASLKDLSEQFFAGFDYRSRAMEWAFTVQRDWFDAFDPQLPPRYGFLTKWRFALWALERQVRRIGTLRKKFMAYVDHPGLEDADIPPSDVQVLEDANAESVLNALQDAEIRFITEGREE
ncbi:MAG: hypothetical protein ACI4Q3_05420 [Kiritimatiellia bacterium]